MTKRIGPKMAQAVDFVAACGGVAVPNRKVCHHVNPSPEPARCENYGYAIVDRAVKAGLLVRSAAPGGNGSVLSLPEVAS
jgi:hypothetical protein